MTRQELLPFYQEYIALLRKYGHTIHDAPHGARPVALRFFAVPDDTAPEENSGELPTRSTKPRTTRSVPRHECDRPGY